MAAQDQWEKDTAAAEATRKAEESLKAEFGLLVPEKQVSLNFPMTPADHPQLKNCALVHGVIGIWTRAGASQPFTIAQMTKASGVEDYELQPNSVANSCATSGNCGGPKASHTRMPSCRDSWRASLPRA